MVKLVCSEFDEFAEALQGIDGRYWLTGPATRCDWRLRVVELGSMTLMAGQDGAANIFHASCLPGVYSLFVPLGSTGGVTVNGKLLRRSDVSWLVPGSEFHMHTGGSQRWLAVMIADTMSGNASADDDALADISDCTRSGLASSHAIADLLALSRRVLRLEGHLVESPAVIAVRAQLLRASLSVAHSMVDAAKERHQGRPPLRRQAILDRAIDLIGSRCDQQIQVDDLSKATGVSERTLRSVFHERFGTSPHHYLMLKRLHDIHSAIRSATPHDTVSEICGRFGIWDFGRFARAYQQQFGLSPSRMLAISKRKQ